MAVVDARWVVEMRDGWRYKYDHVLESHSGIWATKDADNIKRFIPFSAIRILFDQRDAFAAGRAVDVATLEGKRP